MTDRSTSDTLDGFVAAADVEGLATWLSNASTDDLRQARAWYRTGRKRAATFRWSAEWQVDHRDDEPLRRIAYGVAPVLAAGLAGPVSAAKWIGWDTLFYYDTEPAVRRFVDIAVARGHDWCAEFVPAAAAVRPGRRGEREVYVALCAIIRAHDLPVPSGSTFADGWTLTIPWSPAPTADSVAAEGSANPMFPDLFHHALAAGTLGQQRLAPVAAPAAALLIDRGVLDRDRLVAQVVELLAAPLPVGTQRVLAGLVGTLGISAAELPTEPTALRAMIATQHGTVGATLLPFAIDALVSTDDLLELCTTLVARPEKKQRQELVRALAGAPLRERLGTDAVVAGLEVLRAAADDDPRLGERIDKVLASLGVAATDDEPTGAVLGLWEHVPPPQEPFAAKRIGEFPRLTPELVAWIPQGESWRVEPADVLPSLTLAAIVRNAWADGVDSTWATLAPALAHLADRYYSQLLKTLHDGRPGSTELTYAEVVDLAGVQRTDVATRHPAQPYQLLHSVPAFRYLLARETLQRLGRTACMLSTPSHNDLTISFEALVPRLQLNQEASFGPVDLFQTLLRLRPVDPAALSVLDGLSIPLDDAVVPTNRTCSITEAVSAIREWVGAGGLPPLEPVTLEQPSWSTPYPQVELPIAPDRFGVLPDDLFAFSYGLTEQLASVVPAWPDMYGASVRHRFLGVEQRPGRHAYGRLVGDLQSADRDVQAAADQIILDRFARGQFDVELCTSVALELLAASDLSLARLTRALDLLASSGGLRVVWPLALAIAREAARASRKPAGLADLLALLARYAPEVPAPRLPAELIDLARSRGSTQSHLRARELLARTEDAA